MTPSDDLLKKRLSDAFFAGRLVALASNPATHQPHLGLHPAVPRRRPHDLILNKTEGISARTTTRKEPGERPLSRRAPVRTFGIVYKPEGVNLREQPSPAARVVRHLRFNTRVFVDSHDSGWSFVTTDDGRFGYCATTHLDTDLPEPDAKIHWVQSNETALSISRKYYGGRATWGSDHRFYVSGLAYANLGAGKRGIYKRDPDADWDTSQVIAGMAIWIPSLAFLKSLRRKRSSGSLTYEAWESAQSAAQTVSDFAQGAAGFIGGVLHGALESLWDVLVGLKDLATMLWDILSSLLTGNLFADASRLWSDVSKLDWQSLTQGWVERFDSKWNATHLLDRWHFRGWVIGYAIMEALMLIFSGGIIQGIKWVGKASKISKLIMALPQVQRLATAAKGHRAFQRAAAILDKGESLAATAKDATAWIERLLIKPISIWGKGPEQIADVFRKAGYDVTIAQSTKGSKLSKQIQIRNPTGAMRAPGVRFDIQNIQVHPGGGRHGGPYYKISTSSKGTIKVVDRATYVPTLGERATIIYIDTGLQGWMLQAAVANAAAQNTIQGLAQDEAGGH